MRVIRFLLWFIAVIALLAMSYVVAIYFLVNANSVSERISSELDRNFGYKITMHAAPQVRVLPTIEIELPAATVRDSHGQTVFFYRSAYLEVNPIWLVLGQTHIEKLHFDGASAQLTAPNTWPEFINGLKTEKLALLQDVVIKNLTVNQGELNIGNESKKLSLRNIALSVNEPAPQMHGAVEISAQIADTTNGLLFDGAAKLMLDLDLHRGVIGIEDLQLQAQGTRGATPLTLAMSSSLAKLEADHAYVSSGEARVLTNDGNDQFALTVADLQVDTTQWQAPDFHIYFAQGTGQQRLELDVRSPISAQWENQTWQAAHIQGTILLPATSNASPVSGQTYIDWSAQKADIELFARLHDAPMSFKGHIDSFDHPKIKGQLTFGRLDMIELQKLSILQNVHVAHTFSDQPEDASLTVDTPQNHESKPSETDNISSSTVTETTTVETQSNETENVQPQVMPDAQEQQTAQPVASPVVWIDTNEGRFVKTQNVESATAPNADQTGVTEPEITIKPFDFSILNAFDFDGDVIIGELVYHKSRLLQVKGSATVANGTLKMPKLTGLAYESHFSAFASVNALGHWNTQFKASNVNLDGFLRDLGSTVSIPGKLNTQVNLYGDDFTLGTLNGQIGFAVQNTVLYGTDLNDALLTIEKGQVPNQSQNAKSSVAKLQGIATLHATKAEIENLVVGFDGFTLKGRAQINLKDQTISGALKGNNHRGLSVQTALTSTWYQPQLTIDALALMKANGITPKPIMTDKPKEKKPSGWDRLKSFIKDRL